jgi:hypothetical protein
MEYRKCSKCYREKPYYEFYTDKDTYCINCTKKDIEIQRLLNETVKEDNKC